MSENNQVLDQQIQDLLNSSKPVKTKKKGKKKFILIGLGIVVLLFLIASFVFQKKPMGIPVEAAHITKGEIKETLIISGPIEGTDSVDITSNLHAKITELLVKEGDRVEAGVTVLAKIDPETIQKNIDNAKGVLELKQAQRDEKIKADSGMYQKAVSDLEMARKNYDRQAELVASGAAAQTDLEAAKSALNAAQSAVNSIHTSKGKVVAGRSFDIDIENSERELANLEKNLKDAVLIAPISGIVTRVNTKVGQFADVVENNRALITIENLDELQMELRISEYNIGSIQVGQKVEISADILGEETVQGEVISISPTGEKKDSSSNERVIPVKVRILNEHTRLISGINAKATILLGYEEDTFLVPLTAIGDDGTGQRVMQFIVKGEDGSETIRIQKVETGIESELNMELKSLPFEDMPYEEIRFVKAYDGNLTEGQPVIVQPLN